MAPRPLQLKKRKVNGSAATSLGASSTPQDDKDSAKNLGDKLTVPVAQTSQTNLKIQQAKNFAIVQAQKECCMSNFRIFDSPFGNFLVPVIPTRAELGG